MRGTALPVLEKAWHSARRAMATIAQPGFGTKPDEHRQRHYQGDREEHRIALYTEHRRYRRQEHRDRRRHKPSNPHGSHTTPRAPRKPIRDIAITQVVSLSMSRIRTIWPVAMTLLFTPCHLTALTPTHRTPPDGLKATASLGVRCFRHRGRDCLAPFEVQPISPRPSPHQHKCCSFRALENWPEEQ